MHKPRYQTVSGQPVYSPPRWWHRIFGHQPRYAPAVSNPNPDTTDDQPATSSDE